LCTKNFFEKRRKSRSTHCRKNASACAQVTWLVLAIKRRVFHEITEEGVFGNHLLRRAYSETNCGGGRIRKPFLRKRVHLEIILLKRVCSENLYYLHKEAWPFWQFGVCKLTTLMEKTYITECILKERCNTGATFVNRIQLLAIE